MIKLKKTKEDVLMNVYLLFPLKEPSLYYMNKFSFCKGGKDHSCFNKGLLQANLRTFLHTHFEGKQFLSMFGPEPGLFI